MWRVLCLRLKISDVRMNVPSVRPALPLAVCCHVHVTSHSKFRLPGNCILLRYQHSEKINKFSLCCPPTCHQWMGNFVFTLHFASIMDCVFFFFFGKNGVLMENLSLCDYTVNGCYMFLFER